MTAATLTAFLSTSFAAAAALQSPPASMYVGHTSRFRDPFVSEHYSLRHGHPTPLPALASWSSASAPPDFARPLTPPEEMHGHPRHSKPPHASQEHDHQYRDGGNGQQTSRAPGPDYALGQAGLPDGLRHAAMPHANREASPAPPTKFESVAEATNYSSQLRGSNGVSSIAINCQIPRSVNDSGGSLSELAAQITCLFWFESTELLQQIESSSAPFHMSNLVPDAKPSTGFRKWVATILSTTLVAQNVVLLALLFIHRLKKLNPKVRGKPGSEYRLFTVALMLGNKFLDDNTYTNMTWADVSGINVAEIHIMEVEFLSNMKYCLFTSEQDWAQWQSLLGKFFTFIDRAARPVQNPPAPILPPTSSLYHPMAMPSSSVSNQASPPYSGEVFPNGLAYPTAVQRGLTPTPSPLGSANNQPRSRKRSLEDLVEPPAKRTNSGFYYGYASPQRAIAMPMQSVPRLPLPSLSIPGPYPASSLPQQLPPLAGPLPRIHPGLASQSQTPQSALSLGPSPPALQPSAGLASSRTISPYGSSATASPANSLPPSATALQPPAQVSPSYILRQRNSPYRPVYHVSTLLHPQPSQAPYYRSQNVDLTQMHYQPLGTQQRETGRLPYVLQNVYTARQHPQEMTPVHQWPGIRQMPQQAAAKPPATTQV